MELLILALACIAVLLSREELLQLHLLLVFAHLCTSAVWALTSVTPSIHGVVSTRSTTKLIWPNLKVQGKKVPASIMLTAARGHAVQPSPILSVPQLPQPHSLASSAMTAIKTESMYGRHTLLLLLLLRPRLRLFRDHAQTLNLPHSLVKSKRLL